MHKHFLPQTVLPDFENEHFQMHMLSFLRLFRLISKMNTVLERAEMKLDTNWSETGDRYILKLFRDFVFHQVSIRGDLDDFKRQ